MIRLAHPYFLALLLAAAAAAWAMLARRARRGLLFAPVRRVPAGLWTWRRAARAAAPCAFLAGIFLAVVALSRPQAVLDRTALHGEGIAIQMVVDVSGSMEALDFSTRDRYRSRLDVVKDVFADFIRKRPFDQIGLVTFGGFAVSRVPLTLDHGALLHVLSGVQTPQPVLGADGRVANEEELLTAIGDALTTACARLEPSDLKSRIVVLLSDGESNTGLIKPDDAIKAAKALGIKIYTIGVGSTGRAPFLARDVFGRRVIQYADVRMDEALLRRIAAETGGRYFNARDPRGLAQAMADIDRLQKSAIRHEAYTRYAERFPRCLWPGLLLIAAGATLSLAARNEVI